MCSKDLYRLGLYYFNARWYDPQLGRFITEDPIKDGNNWYVYCRNNPLSFIDPTGLMTQETYDRVRQEALSKGGAAGLSEFEQHYGNKKEEYKARTQAGRKYMKDQNAKNEYSTEDVAPNSRTTQGYMNPNERLELSDGTFLTYIHAGVDKGRGETVESSGYYEVVSVKNDQIIIKRIGSDRHYRIQHLNPNELKKHKKGDTLIPGSKIAPFPRRVYGSGSSGPHIDIQETTLNSAGQRVFINPDTHVNEQPGTAFPSRYEVQASSLPVLGLVNYQEEYITVKNYRSVIPRPNN